MMVVDESGTLEIVHTGRWEWTLRYRHWTTESERWDSESTHRTLKQAINAASERYAVHPRRWKE